MNKDEERELYKLYQIYKKAKSVCNPLEFQQRQLDLLYKVSELLLKPLNINDSQDCHVTQD